MILSYRQVLLTTNNLEKISVGSKERAVDRINQSEATSPTVTSLSVRSVMIFWKASMLKAPFIRMAVRRFTAQRSDAKKALLNSEMNSATHRPTPCTSADPSDFSTYVRISCTRIDWTTRRECREKRVFLEEEIAFILTM